jgi:hypothetical protein
MVCWESKVCAGAVKQFQVEVGGCADCDKKCDGGIKVGVSSPRVTPASAVYRGFSLKGLW